jgi:hypothetical protein
MVAVGQKNVGDAKAGDFVDYLPARLDRVDAKIAFGVTNEVTVEVIAVGLGKPWPGEDVAKDLPHRSLLSLPKTSSAAGNL